MKNVGFTPVKDKAKPANATTASSTFWSGNTLNKNSIDFKAAYLPLSLLSSTSSPTRLYVILSLLATNDWILGLKSSIPSLYCSGV